MKQNEPRCDLVEIAVSATFTANLVEFFLVHWMKVFGLNAKVKWAPYNQVFQQLLDERSLLSQNRGANFLLIRFEDWLRDDESPEGQKKYTLESSYCQLLETLTGKIKPYPYFVGVFPLRPDPRLSPLLTETLEQMNARWRTDIAALPHVFPVDFEELSGLYGFEDIFDPAKDRLAHMPFSDEYFAAMGKLMARRVTAWKKPPFKVIVLDADHTLWQGVCGEDGPLGVRVTAPFSALQNFMKAKQEAGFVLALASKNNEADLWEVFRVNSGMLLKPEHFAAWRIDWNPKSENLRALARELNLGLDSFIFVDDNPLECAAMMTRCPEVLTLCLPEDPDQIPVFLKHVWAFDRLFVTEEDRHRTSMYLAEKKRVEARESGTSLNDFLGALELQVTMSPLGKTDLSRAAQLIHKTNQFNLNGRTFDAEEIRHLCESPTCVVRKVEVKDRFGSYGFAGLLLGRVEGDALCLESFLLSCRVLGKNVEDAVLAGTKRLCLERGLSCVAMAYHPTEKNRPFLQFMERTFWTSQALVKENVLSRLSAARIPEVPGHIRLLFASPADQDGPPAEPLALPAPDFSIPSVQAHLPGNQWRVRLVHEDRLRHRPYYQPLFYMTPELVLELPDRRPE